MAGAAHVTRVQFEPWAARGPGRLMLLGPLVGKLLDAPPPPDDLVRAIHPVRWTIKKAAEDGLPLNEHGELDPVFAQAMCRQFGWQVPFPWPEESPPDL